MSYKIIIPSTVSDKIGAAGAVEFGEPNKVVEFPDVSGVVALTSQISGGDDLLNVTASYSLTASYALSSPSAGLTGFVASQNTSAPNDTVNASRLLVSAASTNADFVMQPKGIGAILANLPDSTTAGGDKRGQNAVDLQTNRYFPEDVASGQYAVIGGGTGNRSTNYASVVCGGDLNYADGDRSFIGGGYENIAGLDYGSVLNGYRNELLNYWGKRSTILGGSDNTIAGGFDYSGNGYNTILGGTNNTINSFTSTILGGYNNTISAAGYESVVINGFGNTVDRMGTILLHGYGINPSSIHSVIFGAYDYSGGFREETVLPWRTTTTNTPAELTLDGSAPRDDSGTPGDFFEPCNRIIIPTDTTVMFEGNFVARRANGDNESAAYKITGVIDNNAGTVALAGVPTVTVVHEDTVAWAIAVTADDTNKCLVFTVTGETSKTIKWGGSVRLTTMTA